DRLVVAALEAQPRRDVEAAGGRDVLAVVAQIVEQGEVQPRAGEAEAEIAEGAADLAAEIAAVDALVAEAGEQRDGMVQRVGGRDLRRLLRGRAIDRRRDDVVDKLPGVGRAALV